MMNAFMTFASQILLAAEDGDHGGEELVPGITSENSTVARRVN